MVQTAISGYVRAEHPNFTRLKLNPLIDPNWKPSQSNPDGKLLVRVTGLLMFDSGHFFHEPLTRDTNWEIHPILKMEYCPNGKRAELTVMRIGSTSIQVIERRDATLYFSALERVLVSRPHGSVHLSLLVTFWPICNEWWLRLN